MRNNEVVEYLNSLDFSLLLNEMIVGNVYSEMLPYINELISDPVCSHSLEALIALSNPKQLLKLIKSSNKNLIYKKLGSRIFEKIFKRLFECLFTLKIDFPFSEYFDFLDCKKLIQCSNGTFALRMALMLLSGKDISKKGITKHKIVNESNKIYSKKLLDEYKGVLIDMVDSLEKNDSFGTLGIFIQITKSQSLIKEVIKTDMNIENIKKRGYFYEAVCTAANKRNSEEIYNVIKDSVMDLGLADSTSFVISAFLRNSTQGGRFLNKMDLNSFEENSNVIVALLESLQKSNNYLDVENLLKSFYKIESKVFENLLLKKYTSIDSKFVQVIINFMEMNEKNNFNVNADFVRHFQKEWLNNKSGINLITGFLHGSASTFTKEKFLNKHIDSLWSACKWTSGETFFRSVIKYTNGHSRKKAYEMISKCKSY